MVIGVFGESCVGKSTLAEKLTGKLTATVYSGKDYLRLAKQEKEAQTAFQTLLEEALTGAHVIYVISEPEQLALLPQGALRVLVTADLETIQARFAARMHGNLPAPVAAMLARKHGSFDQEPHDVHIVSGQTDLEEACGQILAAL